MIEISKVKDILSAIIDVPVGQIPDDATMDDLESWDSLAQMNLVIALEEEFQITIPDDEVGTLLSMQLIVALLEQLDR
jgi:acyl carrier protein